MPKTIDENERRTAVAEAVWSLIRNEGIAAASVRNVAAATGLATGSVRHFFPSQAKLHAFALELVITRVNERVAALDLPDDTVEAATIALGELLPLDATRRAENLVWFAFSAAALANPTLCAIRRRAYDDLESACAHWTRQLMPARGKPAQVAIETERLFALIDGLAVHAALRPERVDADLMRHALAVHLTELAGRPSSHSRKGP